MSGDDWFELANRGALPVALGGFTFTDDLADPAKSPVPPLSFLGAGEFAQFFADGLAAAGADHVAFKLASAGTALALFRQDGSPVDRVLLGRQAPGMAGGRVPDGSDFIYALATPTPGRSNALDVDNDGLPDVWERAHGLVVGLDDSTSDPDGDGSDNRSEFRLGTNPQAAASAFRLEVRRGNGAGSDSLSFLATPGFRYFVERYDFSASAWASFKTIPVVPATRTIEVPLELAAVDGGGLFRVTASPSM